MVVIMASFSDLKIGRLCVAWTDKIDVQKALGLKSSLGVGFTNLNFETFSSCFPSFCFVSGLLYVTYLPERARLGKKKKNWNVAFSLKIPKAQK